ncbi:D-beta-D-heptose 1-phosphate adenosyltransferase [Arthrobacter sp. SW1]|uniref:DeoR/GlpR family DNA-binding transcription regulator n=1 Tax=Arthrobacter sp. SW1 TaxID=1920889 RepID=UPI000877E563|nr:DeoR/GlpR family DNA-binding transcription regulator [Arthrobacter sp. SW1]OFI38163.1 D-beta-D-heptose 1-phosphate adenosyltransferase [Arthrobacter sp. SW1]
MASAPDEDAVARAAFADQRHQQILLKLRAEQRVDSAELAAMFGVSGESIRKDLIHLERHGQLKRVHGGAIPADTASFEPAVSARTEYSNEKSRIARAALEYLPHQGSVLIDAGSTTEKLADTFPGDRELTIFTNTLPIALTLVNRPLLTVFTLGGRLRSRTLAEVDEWALRALDEINADVAFLGTNGISIDRGFTTPDAAEAHIKRAMLKSARRRILLSDHSKIGVVNTIQHATLADIDVLITDTGISNKDLKSLKDAGITVEVV